MSVPVLAACAVSALVLGIPVVGAAVHLETSHRAAGIADSAALAAADAASGWIDGEPCAIAADVTDSAGAVIEACSTEAASGIARVTVALRTPIGRAEASARAGPSPRSAEADDGPLAGRGPVGPNGWAWPAVGRAVSQGLHDGFAIDLEVPAGGALYAPYDGVVVFAGRDAGGVPEACQANPQWWRGPNFSVIIRHEVRGEVLYSSHNHVAPESPQRNGVAAGERVRAGQPVAAAGMSGCTSGPHSHFTLATTPTNAYPDRNPFVYIGTP